MPASPTPAQSAASAANGALSRGPVTDAGKAASSRNGVRHGLRSAIIVPFDDEAAAVAELRAELVRRWEPGDAVEIDDVEALLMIRLKLGRLDKLELEVLAARGEERSTLPSIPTLARYRRQLEKEWITLEQSLLDYREKHDEEPADAGDEIVEDEHGMPIAASPANLCTVEPEPVPETRPVPVRDGLETWRKELPPGEAKAA